MPQAAQRIRNEEADYREHREYREHRTFRRPQKRARRAERAHVNTALRTKALVIFLLFMVTAGVTLARRELGAMRGYELVQIRQMASQIENENKELEVRIAKLKAPQRIKDIAINRLGMVVPQEFYFAAENK